MATRPEANRTASLQRSDTMKPGSKDKRVSLLIAGDELTELKRLTWLMSESFGLGTRIENYNGKRPIGLYSWDFECLLAIVDHALKDDKEHPDKTAPEYHALTQLSRRLLDAYHKSLDN